MVNENTSSDYRITERPIEIESDASQAKSEAYLLRVELSDGCVFLFHGQESQDWALEFPAGFRLICPHGCTYEHVGSTLEVNPKI